MEEYGVVVIEYFLNISFNLFILISAHNFIDRYYPFNHHDYKNKTKNIVEGINILVNTCVCYIFMNEIIVYNTHNYSKVDTITNNTVYAIELLFSDLVYESIFYYIVLGRKDNLVLFHHIYTSFTLLQYLFYQKLHYYLSMTSLVEFTNIFLSGIYICKRNNAPFFILLLNGGCLLFSFTILRILFIPYIFYEYIQIYDDTYNFSNPLYLNGICILIMIWGMSIFWYKRLIEIVVNDYNNYNQNKIE